MVPVTLYGGANLWFHLGAMTGAGTGAPRRAGFAVVVLLIALIGGRIIPSFTRNWLAARGTARLPVPVSRFDGISIGVTAAALALWVAQPEGWATGATLVGAAGLQAVRLGRWRGGPSWRSPLLLMLHLAYGMLALGLAATGLGALGLVAPLVGYHLLGIGAVAGMTLAVMMRAAMGHTGRPLVAGRTLALAFALLPVAAALRVLAGSSAPLLLASGAVWTLGFGLFCLRVGPWLLTERAGLRKPTVRDARSSV